MRALILAFVIGLALVSIGALVYFNIENPTGETEPAVDQVESRTERPPEVEHLKDEVEGAGKNFLRRGVDRLNRKAAEKLGNEDDE